MKNKEIKIEDIIGMEPIDYNLNFDKEKSNKIHYTVIRAAAIGVPEYKFKLQDGRIYIEIPLNLNNNSIIK